MTDQRSEWQSDSSTSTEVFVEGLPRGDSISVGAGTQIQRVASLYEPGSSRIRCSTCTTCSTALEVDAQAAQGRGNANRSGLRSCVHPGQRMPAAVWGGRRGWFGVVRIDTVYTVQARKHHQEALTPRSDPHWKPARAILSGIGTLECSIGFLWHRILLNFRLQMSAMISIYLCTSLAT